MSFTEILNNLGELPKNTPTIVTDRIWDILVDWIDEMITVNNYVIQIDKNKRRTKPIIIRIRVFEVADNGQDIIHLTTTIIHKDDIGISKIPDAVSALLRRYWDVKCNTL